MNLKEFRSIIKGQFPCLDATRSGNQFWSSDGSIGYSTKTEEWTYFLSKSTAGTGATLSEAICNAQSAQSSDLSLYDS